MQLIVLGSQKWIAKIKLTIRFWLSRLSQLRDELVGNDSSLDLERRGLKETTAVLVRFAFCCEYHKKVY